MSKFKKGETSTAITLKKEQISKSLDKKNKILSDLKNIDDIKKTLPLNRTYLSERSILEWEDENLDITKCSRNTAHQEYNKNTIISISSEIKRLNKIISSESFNKEIKNSKTNHYSILKNENEELKNCLAEIYRAYIQLVEMINKENNSESSIRKTIKKQRAILDKRNISGVN